MTTADEVRLRAAGTAWTTGQVSDLENKSKWLSLNADNEGSDHTGGTIWRN